MLVLGSSGCATKKYVRNQVAPVSAQLHQFEKKTNDQIAFLNSKQQSDVSQLNERISTTDQKVAEVGQAAQQAQGSAARAMTEAEANSGKISSLRSDVANSMNYQITEKGDVTFGFNKSTLTPDAKVVLDAIAAKVAANPRSQVNLFGFTDPVGGKEFNLALSRRRAWAVQNYLIKQKVPAQSIHIAGLGREATPADLALIEETINPNATRAERHRLARRVLIRVYTAPDMSEGSAGRSSEP
jgi:outer membrane protein OmpA-like peptidoglycan-associated protein